MGRAPTRRTFLGGLVFGFASIVRGIRPLWAAGGAPSTHPEPRPGIDAAGVLTGERLRADGFGDDVVEVFDMIREIPELADGLNCYCGCMILGNRSLLTCYYEGGMARGCAICQGEGRLAHRRWKEGQTLEQIRRAIDARFAA
jgi:hypothetical protein